MFDHLSSGFEGTIWSYRYPFFPHSVAAKELYITIRVTRSFPSTWKIIPSKQWDFHGLLWTFHMILTNQNGPNWGFHDLAIKEKQKPWWMPSGGLGWMGIHHLKSRREPSKFRMINHFQWYLSPVFFWWLHIYIHIHINVINCIILYYHYDDHYINGMCHGSDDFIAGWWFGTFLFYYILGIIIPTGYILQRGRYTTNQPWFLYVSRVKYLIFPIKRSTLEVNWAIQIYPDYIILPYPHGTYENRARRLALGGVHHRDLDLASLRSSNMACWKIYYPLANVNNIAMENPPIFDR